MRFNSAVLTIGAFTIATMAALADSPRRRSRAMPPNLSFRRRRPRPSVFVKVVGWPAGKAPTAPAGFTVTEIVPRQPGSSAPAVRAAERRHPGRGGQHTAKTGQDREEQTVQDVRQSKAITPSQNRISLLRDANGDGKMPSRSPVFLENFNRPFRRRARRRHALCRHHGCRLSRIPMPAGWSAWTTRARRSFRFPRVMQRPLDAQPRRQRGGEADLRYGRLGQQRGRARMAEEAGVPPSSR